MSHASGGAATAASRGESKECGEACVQRGASVDEAAEVRYYNVCSNKALATILVFNTTLLTSRYFETDTHPPFIVSRNALRTASTADGHRRIAAEACALVKVHVVA
eukprot:SAG25_NODE_8774_length_405_cov_0.669935_1_plen_106_part_00